MTISNATSPQSARRGFKPSRVLMFVVMLLLIAAVLTSNGGLLIPNTAYASDAIAHGVNQTVRPMVPLTVLWDQPLDLNLTNVFVSQKFTNLGSSIYDTFEADDFVNSVPWQIQKIYIPGDANGGSLLNASALNFQIYTDSSGKPGGDPSGGGNPPVWSLSLLPTDGQITLTNGISGAKTDVTLTLTAPLTLPAGHYWLVFYPEMDYAGGMAYGREASTSSNDNVAQTVNPGQGWLGGYSSWTSTQTIYSYFTDHDFAFHIEGNIFGSISGEKFNDINGNGSKDGGEPGLQGWTIQLIDPSDNSVITTQTTDPNGNYKFSDLAAGTYRVREVLQAGWQRTTTNPADIVLAAGQDVTDVDFGNASARLDIVKTGLLSSNHASITWTLKVGNKGPSNAMNVVAKDALVITTKWVSSATTKGSCTGTSTVTCNLGTLVPDEIETITIKVNVLTQFLSFTNTGTVKTTTAEPASANNSSTATVP